MRHLFVAKTVGLSQALGHSDRNGWNRDPMRLIISFASLLLSVLLLQLSSGGVGPLDALSGLNQGFTTTEIGMLGSAHFFGFFIGCWWAPRLMGSIGHSRAFAAFAATGAIGILAHMMLVSPTAWAIMRVASGLCVAGCYTVIEAWLQAKLTNQLRGRVMGAYRLVDVGGSLSAQLLIGVLEPASYVSYNLLAILCCASLLPLTLSRAAPPETPEAPRLRPLMVWRISPLAAAGVIVSAITSASFRMVGPLYGTEVGLPVEEIALFLAAFVLGGAFSQVPVGWLADKLDRRWVLITLSGAAIFSSVITVAASSLGPTAIFATAVFFGMTTFPIFSVSSAHAADFATPEQQVELAAAIMFAYAVGAIARPLVSSYLMDSFGPRALFLFIATVHLALILFSLGRMRSRPTVGSRTHYVWLPRTSFSIGRLIERRRSRD